MLAQRPGAAIALILVATTSMGCGEEARGTAPGDSAVLVPATDEDSSVGVVEVSLEARPAKKRYANAPPTSVWAYNGLVPGPLLEANVGDELVVHFRNSLPEDTTIHWHGVRVPAAMDGTAAVQSPIPPGGTFEYRFALKDAGLFWFHPHIRSDVQVEKGLYGALLVHSPNEPVSDHEQVLILDDVRVLADGSLPTYLDDDAKMLGRQGNVLLVNGSAMPRIPWRSGAVERLRIVNAANGRFFNLTLPGYVWQVIGTDGGLLPVPYSTQHLLVAPGERYDAMLIVQGAPRAEVTLIDDPYDRGHDTGRDAPLDVATFVVSDEPPLTGRVLPESSGAVERLPLQPVDQEVELDEGLMDGNLMFTINGASYPDVPPIEATLGAVRRFRVSNLSEMDHPFHVHGTFFQVLDANDVPLARDALANKDTVIVPQQSSLSFITHFEEPGTWMYHCHIFEHAEGGMMGEIDVSEAP